MKFKGPAIALLASLLGCQSSPRLNETHPEETKTKIFQPNLEQVVQKEVEEDGKVYCSIDTSNHFIPELLSLSKHAEEYFTTEGSLADPFQRERFGIFSSFAHHQKPFEHHVKAIEKRGNNKQPKIEGFVAYTNKKDLKNEKKQKFVKRVKDVQRILFWEGFLEKEPNGIYDLKTTNALIKYQKFHLQLKHRHFYGKVGIYLVEANGRVDKATKMLLNKDLEDYAKGGVRRVLEERVFHMRCIINERIKYPYVIEQKELDKLVDTVAEEIGLNNLNGIKEFFENQPNNVSVRLNIPQRYQQDFMDLGVEVEKWSSRRFKHPSLKTKLILYTIEDDERIELFRTRAVVGGWSKVKGKWEYFHTPIGKRYLKELIMMPYWRPPDWAEEEEGDLVTLPGPYNAFGMIAAPAYITSSPQENPYRAWQEGDDGIRNHLTPWPSSIELGGLSHSCIRIHPNMSRYFFFITEYTPHKLILEEIDGKQYLKFTEKRGSIISYKPEHYISFRICKKACKDEK